MNIVANCVWVTHFQLAGGDVAFPSFNAGPAIVLTADGAAMVGMIVPTDRMKSAVVSSSRCFQWEAEQLAGWLLFLGLAVWFFTTSLNLSSSCIAAVSVVGFRVLVQALPPAPSAPNFLPTVKVTLSQIAGWVSVSNRLSAPLSLESASFVFLLLLLLLLLFFFFLVLLPPLPTCTCCCCLVEVLFPDYWPCSSFEKLFSAINK